MLDHLGDVTKDTVADARHGDFCKIVTTPASPNQHVVGQMLDDIVPSSRRRETTAKCCYVLMIPRVPICNRGSICNASYLIAIPTPLRGILSVLSRSHQYAWR